MKVPTTNQIGGYLQDACRAIAPILVFTYCLGYAFGEWLYQLNDDITCLFTGRVTIDRPAYITRLRGRGMTIKAIATKLNTTEYQVKKAIKEAR